MGYQRIVSKLYDLESSEPTRDEWSMPDTM